LFSGKIEVRRNVGDIVWIRKKITLFFPSASFEQKWASCVNILILLSSEMKIHKIRFFFSTNDYPVSSNWSFSCSVHKKHLLTIKWKSHLHYAFKSTTTTTSKKELIFSQKMRYLYEQLCKNSKKKILITWRLKFYISLLIYAASKLWWKFKKK
jgi:hypothetical protein